MGATSGKQVGVGITIDGSQGAATMVNNRAIFGTSPPLSNLPVAASCTTEGNTVTCQTVFKDCVQVQLEGKDAGTTVWSCVPQGEENAGEAKPVKSFQAPTTTTSSGNDWTSGNMWMWVLGIIVLVIIIAIVVKATQKPKVAVVAPVPANVAAQM